MRPPAPGLTSWLGVSLLLAAASSAWAWSEGLIGLLPHLATTLPLLYFSFICIHDGVHGVLHRSPLLNDALALAFGAAVGLPFPLLRHAHLTHHQTVGHPEDPESIIYSASLPRLLLRLPLVPAYYLRSLPALPPLHAAAVVAQLGGWLALALTFGAPLVVGWLLPVGLTILWFGFTTVYVPHCAHRRALMRAFNLHSGYHDDHHRDPRYPFHQYFELRLEGLRSGASTPTHAREAAWLRWATAPLGRASAPPSETPSGS